MTLTMKCQLLRPRLWLTIFFWTLRPPANSLSLGSVPDTLCAIGHAW